MSSDTIELLKSKRTALQKRFQEIVAEVNPALDEFERKILEKYKIEVAVPSFVALASEAGGTSGTSGGSDSRGPALAAGPDDRTLHTDRTTLYTDRTPLHDLRAKSPALGVDDTADDYMPSGRMKAISKTRMIDADKGRASRNQTLDLAFLIDCTGSMKVIIKEVEQKLQEVLKQLQEDFGTVETRVAFVGYRDFGDKEQHVFVDFNTPSVISQHAAGVSAYGGGDIAEDVLGGYNEALKLSWSSRYRVLLHFADAPPHGKRFHTIPPGTEQVRFDRFYDVDPPYPGAIGQNQLDDLITKLCEKSIYTNMFLVGTRDLSQMATQFQMSFEKVVRGRDMFQTSKITHDPKDFVGKVLSQVTTSMMSSGARKKK
ncbi:hypothetical protein BC937DRAFT_90765 [Endogone sp. FLAS-F59071]|nr:hypothetical protein BC937DRAFT_90765 [Endogone sp. FLAS-F59071]|eukprot:RUS16815.1 hypothetical protein BC937DRAFT_90765 [Endogone sp. FLAS-F59071]